MDKKCNLLNVWQYANRKYNESLLLAEVFMRFYESPGLKRSHFEKRRNNAAYWYSYFESKEKRK